MRILPQTALGKASLTISIIGVVSFSFMQIMVTSGQTGGEKFTDNLLLAVPGAITAICAVVASLVGTVAIIRRRERSLLTFIVSTVGYLILAFLIGELASPH